MLKRSNQPLKRSTKALQGTNKPLRETKQGKGLKKGKRLASRPKTEAQIQEDKENQIRMWELFEQHWNSKPHICQSCDEPIYGENKSLYHDHLLEKSVYDELKYEIENLFLCCWECHDNKGRGYASIRHQEAINRAKVRFNIS